MAALSGQTTGQLETAAGDLASTIERELAAAMRSTLEQLGGQLAAAAADRVSPDDLSGFLATWGRIVDDVLMGAVEAQYTAASLEEIDRVVEALSGTLTADQLQTLELRLSGQTLSEAHLATARNRLVGLGEEVWLTARDELTVAMRQGESIDSMVDRIVSATDEVGETRAARIARTETISVRNAASLDVVDQVGAAAVKRWQATLDSRTRETHASADGQEVPQQEPFTVGGASLQHPGDPAGPPAEIINCRCTMTFEISDEALNALLEDESALTAAANEHIHDGAMIALVPTEEDAQRLAIDDMEPVDELHLTLQFLGDANELPADAVETIAAELETLSGQRGPVTGEAFAVDWFNPAGDEPAWVLGISGEELAEMNLAALAAASSPDPAVWAAPVQHQPWVAHVTLAYSGDVSLAETLVDRLGEVTFDRLRLAVGDDVRDFTLGQGDTLTAATDPEGGRSMAIDDMSTRDGVVQGVAIVEGTPTGDGRIFTEGAISWPDPAEVLLPLEWQKETTHGGDHDVTVSVGRLTSLNRVGNEIRFEAVLDLESDDGAEAWRRYQDGFIGGVSIIGDDPEDPFGKDVELVWPEQCEIRDDMSEEEMLDAAFSAECMAPDMIVHHSTRLRSLTLVNVPALTEASARLQPLAASAAHMVEVPDRPPRDWFDEPTQAPEIGTIQINDNGRLFGYLAPKGVAHRAFEERVEVPLGNVDYRSWMNRPTIVAGGERIATGAITMDCGHASTMAWVGAKHSIDHYDNACSVVATARIGENNYGVWVAGALVPGVSGTQVARMLACQLSGDWRAHRSKPGWREFTGALVVPVPGFTSPSMRINDGALAASAVPIRPSWARTLTAAVIGSTDLPVASRDTDWDGQAALGRVFDLCTDGDQVDVDCVSRAFLWRAPDADPTNRGSYSLGFADVVEGRLQIIPAGVAAAAGGRGVDAADIPAEDKERVRTRICSLYDTIRDQIEDWPDCPFEDDEGTSSTGRAFTAYADTLLAGAGLDPQSRAAAAMSGVR